MFRTKSCIIVLSNGIMNNREDCPVVIPNFFRVEPHELYASNIGWNESDISDARSDDPEQIFRYYIEVVGYNMSFYYLDDGCFYCIVTELFPLMVQRRYKNSDWDGKYIIDSAIGSTSTHEGGEVIYTTEDPTRVWNELMINDMSIGEVLKRSVVLGLG